MTRISLITLAGVAAAALSLGACDLHHDEGYDHHAYADHQDRYYGSRGESEHYGVQGDADRDHAHDRDWHDRDGY